jgi:uncharacterized ion transporter superfamily protein YfcC
MKGKKISFPSAYTVLFLVAILAAISTWILPAGKFDQLSYSADSKEFIELKSNGEKIAHPGTQQTLDKFNIKIGIGKFENGDIWKPVGIPNTYTQVDANPQGLKEIFESPMKGVYDSMEIILFVLIIGGFIGVINSTGAFDSGINHLAVKLKGREKWMIVLVVLIIATGGTSFGLAEETIAFYPLLVPVFLIAGYDAIVALAAIYIGSSIGTMASTTNPFSTIIASNSAGVNWTSGLEFRAIVLGLGIIISIIYIIRYAEKVKKDPSKSIIYKQKEELENTFLHSNQNKVERKWNLRTKLTLVLFASSFIIMVYGVSQLNWWFLEMTTLFFVASIILALVERISEKNFIKYFIDGAKDLLGVALIIGIARGVTFLLENGNISGTLLYYSSNAVEGMNSGLFINTMMFLFSGLSFFVPSSSGLAVLSMPIMAPLADVVSVPREILVSSYQYGMGLMAFITPTGLILASLTMVNVTYDKWLKFILPLLGILTLLAMTALTIEVYL